MDTTKECPFCGLPIKLQRWQSHVSARCPKSPAALKHRGSLPPEVKRKFRAEKRPPEIGGSFRASTKQEPKIVQLRSRLGRLFRELEVSSNVPDDKDLAREFRAFYEYYVRLGPSRASSPRRSTITNSDGSRSVSIKAVSGGLPSLGKNAK
jgi:hypothetical protein